MLSHPCSLGMMQNKNPLNALWLGPLMCNLATILGLLLSTLLRKPEKEVNMILYDLDSMAQVSGVHMI